MTQRQEIIERLRAVDLGGGSHESLSAICKAVLPHGGAWTLRMCADLRDRLVRLLGEAEQPNEQGEGEEEESKEGHAVEQLRRESVVTRLRMAQQGGYDGSTGFVRGNVYQLFGVGEKSYDSIYFLAGNIATEVEREIASAKSAAYDQGYDHGYQEGKRDGDDEWYEEHESYLEEHGWYQALDADKQTIRFNDDVEWELLGSGETERGYVVGIKIDLIAGRQSCRVKVVRDSDFQTIELMAKNLHHVKPAEPEPTVEDVLTEFAAKLIERGELTNGAAQTIAEYAAKLRLAGDAE